MVSDRLEKGDTRPKDVESSEGIPKVRPICLLDELGKGLEKIIVSRMKRWMTEHPEADVSPHQYGFREGRSTCDALLRVRHTAETARAGNAYAIAISLDVANAFNSLP